MLKAIVILCMASWACALNTKYLPPAISSVVKTEPQSAGTQHQSVITHTPVPVNKNFYIFTAPAETNVHYQRPAAVHSVTHTQPQLQQKRQQQQQNVIIINTPAATNVRTVQQTHAQPIAYTTHTQHNYQSSEPNLIEFLRKQQVVVAQQPQQHKQHRQQQQIVYHPQQQQPIIRTTKPEVHFIKYRTPAEALQIQQRILQQYGFPTTTSHNTQTVAAASAPAGAKTPAINIVKQTTGNAINLDAGSVAGAASSPVATTTINAQPISIENSNLNAAILPPHINSNINNANNNIPIDKNYARKYLPPGKDVLLGSSYLPLV